MVIAGESRQDVASHLSIDLPPLRKVLVEHRAGTLDFFPANHGFSLIHKGMHWSQVPELHLCMRCSPAEAAVIIQIQKPEHYAKLSPIFENGFHAFVSQNTCSSRARKHYFNSIAFEKS
jgi:hypothetical protein